jgi:dihydrodipicolinate synthase/N-acetylneuraminate lyase
MGVSTSNIASVTRRAIAAALTPLTGDGARIDLEAIPPYAAFLAAGGINGILALGSTGEGILLSVAERKDVLSAFAACELPVIAHCGAQTTADTVALAEHAATAGVAGVAVIGPPYFPLDDESLLRHFAAAARACEPLPFYVYEFERVSGYAVSPAVVERLRELAPNLAGLKVSDSPFDKVRPYLVDGLELLVGAEALIGEALAAGGAGAVSGLASAFPDVVAEAVRTGDSTRAGELRALLDRFQRLAALKVVVASKGVPLQEDMRAPLRRLSDDERRSLFAALEAF